MFTMLCVGCWPSCLADINTTDHAANPILHTACDYTVCSLFLSQAHMKFPSDYPYSPPSIRFLTKVWHPNVYEVGLAERVIRDHSCMS